MLGKHAVTLRNAIEWRASDATPRLAHSANCAARAAGATSATSATSDGQSLAIGIIIAYDKSSAGLVLL